MKSLKTIIILVVLQSICTIASARGTYINHEMCKEFLEVRELYLLETYFNDMALWNKEGQLIRFSELVTKAWPEKRIKFLSTEDFDKMPYMPEKFFISIAKLTDAGLSNSITSDGLSGIVIKKGKFEDEATSMVAWLNVNIDEISYGIAPERLIFALNNLQYLIKNTKDNNHKTIVPYKTIVAYKSDACKNYLANKTLLIPIESLDEDFRSADKIKEVYPYNFKIVNQEEWAKAIAERDPAILYLEEFNKYGKGWHRNGFDIYNAEDGKMIFSSFDWLQTKGFYKIKGNFFSKLLH